MTNMAMPLKGIRVLEIAGLAPVPYCGMILADFGASVIRVDRVKAGMNPDRLARGKRSIAVDLKSAKGHSVVERLALKSDVLIEPFRPGVMEKLNLGPDRLLKQNPRLIYARLSGYGQTGPNALKAGHDINYVAMTGILNMLGRKGDQPTPPANLLADFAGGGLITAFGIALCLFERNTSGKGQVVDASLLEGAAYVSAFIYKGIDTIIWGKNRGENLLDTGAPFYDTYKTKDDKYMAVGSLEPQFYARLMQGLQLDIDQFADFDESKKTIAERFASRTRDEWTAVFEKLDACVTPILDLEEAAKDKQNVFRGSLPQNPHTKLIEPQAAPVLSRTPGKANFDNPDPLVGEHTKEILKEVGYRDEEIEQLVGSGAVEANSGMKSKL